MGGVLRWQRPLLSADGGGGDGGVGARWLSDCGGGDGDCEWQWYDEGQRREQRWLH